jgi:hypothetical protein
MKPDKKQAEETKTKADAVETPPPPQHMDPSKQPDKDTGDSKSPGKKNKK